MYLRSARGAGGCLIGRNHLRGQPTWGGNDHLLVGRDIPPDTVPACVQPRYRFARSRQVQASDRGQIGGCYCRAIRFPRLRHDRVTHLGRSVADACGGRCDQNERFASNSTGGRRDHGRAATRRGHQSRLVHCRHHRGVGRPHHRRLGHHLSVLVQHRRSKLRGRALAAQLDDGWAHFNPGRDGGRRRGWSVVVFAPIGQSCRGEHGAQTDDSWAADHRMPPRFKGWRAVQDGGGQRPQRLVPEQMYAS